MLTSESLSSEQAAKEQAHDLSEFVSRDGWVRRIRPGTYHRHKTPERSLQSILGIIAQGDVVPQLFRRESGLLVALGTVVSQFAVVSPLDRREVYSGRQIDYHASDDVTDDEHAEIANTLAEFDDYRGQVLATLSQDETERAAGIPATMHAVGEPARLRVPRGYNDLGINSFPEPLQLYVRSISGEG